MGIVYLHLIACCVAVGLVFVNDMAMVKQLVGGASAEEFDAGRISTLQKTVSRALLALWISGAAIVALDVSLKGWGYFANPKLQSKLMIVMLLTLNGYALHKYVLPLLKKSGSLLNLSLSQRSVALLTGTVSGVSWFYAAMLGIGRPLNWKYSLVEIMAAYPVLIAAGFIFMMLLTSSRSRVSGGFEPRLINAN